MTKEGSMPKSIVKAKKTKSRAPKPSATARVFWSGRSQAVRLPKAFRLQVAEVTVKWDGKRLVLEPLEIERDAQGWPVALWELAGAAPEFDVGERAERHERGDVLAPRR